MELVKGQVVTVTRTVAGTSLVVDAAMSDTVLFLDDVSDFSDDGGSVSIDGTVYEYAADSVDRDAESLTLTAGVASALTAYDTFVAIYPDSPANTAEVLLTDDSGVTVTAVIPQNLRALLDDGVRDPDDREAVSLMHDDDGEWTVYDVSFRPPIHNATTVPIVITDADGETARLDAEGLTFSTNDLVALRLVIDGSFANVAADGGRIFGRDTVSDDIKAYDSTGALLYTITGTFVQLAASDGYVYAIDSASDINKRNAADGSAVGGAFPIPGSFVDIAASDANLYAIDSASDIKAYDSAGALLFTITGTFSRVAADGGYVYAIDSANDVRKYDGTTGVEDASVWPLVGSYTSVGADSGNVYAKSSADGHIYGYDAETKTLLPNFPIEQDIDQLSAGDGYIFGNDSNDDIVKYSTGATIEETVHIDGPTGEIEYLLNKVHTTKAERVNALNIAHNTTTVLALDTFTGSARSGVFWRWDATNFRFWIVQDGVYDLSAFIRLAANATGNRIGTIRVNGTGLTSERPGPTSTTWDVSLAASGVPLVVGDYVDITAFHSAGVGVTLSAVGSWLNIKRAGILAA